MLVQCNGEAKEAKEQIISLLGQDFPLTAKKLYNLMKKHYMTGTTYHAIYKHLNELVRRGVVTKEGVEYRLSGKWIERTKTFVDNVGTNYSGFDIKLENFNFVALKSQTDFYKFVADFRRNEIERMKKGDEILWIGNHTWGPLLFMNSVTNNLSIIKSKGLSLYLCIRGSTRLDAMTADFYKSMGFKNVVCGEGNYQNLSVYVFGNVAMIAIFDDKITSKINALFEGSNSLRDFDLSKIHETIFGMESPVHVFIVRSAEFVETYRSYIKSFF